jgi:ABC-type branched-subunit amino acid transport system substrate-binding protein
VRECAELATKEYNNYGGIHGNDLLEYFGVEE